MTSDQGSVDLVRRYVEAVNTRRPEELDAIFAPDFVNHGPDGPAHGLGAFKAFVSRVMGIWPELEITIDAAFTDESFVSGTRVGALVTLRENNAELGRTLKMREIWIFRISEGKLAERWYVLDRAALNV